MAVTSQFSLTTDFFLIAHDPFEEGRLVISPALLGCGLVGTKLVELVLARRLRIQGDDTVLAVDAPAASDEIDDYVVDAVRDQSAAHPVRAWIEPLEEGLYELVGERLVATGAVRRADGGKRFGRGRQPDRFPPADLLTVSAPQQRLQQTLRSPRDLMLADGMLVACWSVLGGDRLIAPEVDRATVRDIAAECVERMPSDLRTVYDALLAVAGDMSLRVR